MTITDEAAVTLAQDEAAVALARESAAQLHEVRALIHAAAEWAEWAIAGGDPAKPVAYQLIEACRLVVGWPAAERQVAP